MDASFSGLLSFGAQDMLTTAGSPVTLAHRSGGSVPTTAVLTVQSGDLSAIFGGERMTIAAHALLPLSAAPVPGDTLAQPDGSRWTILSAVSSPAESVFRCDLARKA
jgi:hypothetical protein